MEASVRILNPTALNRHIPASLLLKPHPHLALPHRLPNPPRRRLIAIATNPNCFSRFHTSLSHPNSIPLGFSQFISPLHASNSSLPPNNFDPFVSNSNEKFFEWNFASQGGNVGVVGDNGPVVTVVLLGWLGAKPKHLRRYVELYNSKGINAATLVASVRDVLWFDLGRKLEQRISALAHELGSWLGESQRDGRERLLIFHTFSNTGWLAYGAILDNLQGRQDVLMKIKGCVVDSGGDPEINPKVWAAGFTAALLKKRSSSAFPPTEGGEGLESERSLYKAQQKQPLLIEVILLVALEKFFSFILNLPDIKQRLKKVIFTLLRNQPPCPQLYLYSTADIVIPSQSVESFIEKQRRKGREVWCFNFGSSPHVDHYRTFPDIYSSQLQHFLKECLALVNKT